MAIWSTRTPKKKTKLSNVAKPKQNPYHCVELVVDYDACQAATQLASKRFLSAEAPFVPLAKCDQANCNCYFRHHEDRRHEDRRDPFSYSGIHTAFSEKDNRRIRGERRKNYDSTPSLKYY